MLLLVPVSVCAEETATDSALWVGAWAFVENKTGLDYSLEFQHRRDDHMSSFSNQFVEFMGYHKISDNLLVNAGYRFTQRTDHLENRLYFGGFLDLTKTALGVAINPDRFRATLQMGYQRDFNTEENGEVMDSNSIRWVLVVSKPATKKITPLLLGGILTTWNDANSFGVDKVRLGGGLTYQVTRRSRVRAQYIWERSRFREPKLNTNILWLRYEMIFSL